MNPYQRYEGLVWYLAPGRPTVIDVGGHSGLWYRIRDGRVERSGAGSSRGWLASHAFRGNVAGFLAEGLPLVSCVGETVDPDMVVDEGL